jgi:hypothetical protein
MNSMTDRMDSTMMPGMTKTSRKRPLLIALGLIALIGGWALFRPELLFIDKTVNESLPGGSAAASDSGAMTLAQGNFHSVAHETKGTATIHRLANGKRVVRLTDFETSNGPDVHVFAVAANDASDSETVKQSGYVDLGSLKGNVGDQNYDLPDNLDLSKYRAITIWCNRFNVNFGTAPLAVPGAATSQSADARPVSLASGMFHSVAHETKGSAAVYRIGEKRLLRLTDFETSNGPDVRVYLVAAPDASDSDTVKNAGFVELGKLKGNVGDQNYDIPGDVDLDKYRAVTVWCARFGVNFGTAPLK